jgi:hypothetical protein
MLRNPVSKRNLSLIFSGLLLTLTAMAVVLRPKPALADVGVERSGHLHVTKECSKYDGTAGSYCTITSSNFSGIPAGSLVLYTQAAVGTAAFEASYIGLDSNVVLYVASGDWAVGRCTLDGTASYGICAFSNGNGQLTGFHARVAVAPTDTSGINYSWDGAYGFSSGND